LLGCGPFSGTCHPLGPPNDDFRIIGAGPRKKLLERCLPGFRRGALSFGQTGFLETSHLISLVAMLGLAVSL
jgi:hypothetical protein